MPGILFKLAVSIPLTVQFHYERLLEFLKRRKGPMEPNEPSIPSTPPPGALENASDIFRTAALLRLLPIPTDLIPSILDFAGYHYRITAAWSNVRKYISQQESGTIYLAADLPTNLPPTSLRRIIFTTTSHDQGYSWDYNNHNTYNGSWTWFGVAILNHERPEEFQLRVEGNRVITNMHAEQQFRTHSVVWNQDDAEANVQDAFRALRTGKLIALTICAAYPAWINFVRSASIQFDIQPVRKL